jgi:drug/metabolite transporter (DMT)-like permease
MGSAQVGIALALVAALAANTASLLKHRGCQGVEPVDVRRPLLSARRLAASRWFAAGWSLAAAAWLVHVAALSMAPISLVQAVLAGGAVTLAVMAQRIFGEPVERRQWLALLLGACGLALLVVTVPQFQGSHSEFAVPAILGFEGGLALLAIGLALGHRSERLAARRGVLLAALAGTLFAFAGMAIKGLTGAGGMSVPVVALWIGLIVACGALAQYTTVAALQRGGAIETIGLMGLVANATQIAGGVLVFGDPLSASPLGIALQTTAFAMVCSSALLLPARPAGGGAGLPGELAPARAYGG